MKNKNILILFFILNIFSFILKNLYMRVFGVLFGNDIYSFSAVTAVFILGSGLGYLFFIRFSYRIRIKGLLGILALYLLFSIGANWLSSIVPIFNSNKYLYQMFKIFYIACVVPIFPLIIAIIYPYAIQLYKDNEKNAFIDIYITGILGLLTGCIIFPYLLKSISFNIIMWMMFLIICIVYFLNKTDLNLRLTKENAKGVHSRDTCWTVGTKDNENPPQSPFDKGGRQGGFTGETILNKKNVCISIFIFLFSLFFLSIEVKVYKLLSLVFGYNIFNTSSFILAICLGFILSGFLLKNKKFAIMPYEKTILFSLFGIILFFSLLSCIFEWLQVIYLYLLILFRTEFILIYIILSLTVIFIPALFYGVIFFSVISIFNTDMKSYDKSAAYISLFDALGASFGTVLSGIILIEKVEISKMYFGSIIGFLILALFFTIEYKNTLKRFLKIIAPLIILILVCYDNKFNLQGLSSGAYYYASEFIKPVLGLEDKYKYWLKTIRNNKNEYLTEGILSILSVKKDSEDNLSILINGKADASSMKVDAFSNKLLVYLPVLYLNDFRKACIIGLASGITLAGALEFNFNEIDCVEIEPKMKEAYTYFKYLNKDPLKDKRVNLIINDGRNFISLTDKKYDLIISHPSNPLTPSSNSLMTREFYKICKEKLNTGGVMVSWVQLYRNTLAGVQISIKTFSEVFESSEFYFDGISYLIMLGFNNKQVNQINTKLFTELSPKLKALEILPQNINGLKIPAKNIKRIRNNQNIKINSDFLPVLEILTAENIYNDESSKIQDYLFR